MKFRNLLLCLLAMASLSLTACNLANEDTAQTKTTFFGLYTYEPASYKPTDDASATITTDDAIGMELPSGDKTSFLWGLISIQDY